ncbi:MAG: hypothetical protein NZ700_09155, partial [Gemmataceae bacterium]|nr:hypothetical protein [Gemmataceae bacterium]MDW8265347.1 hypothetical protein [Gemmataceae bacterium]
WAPAAPPPAPGGAVAGPRGGGPRDTVVYVAAVEPARLVPQAARTWARILSQVSGSRLVLFPERWDLTPLIPWAAVRRWFERLFEQEGVAPDRLLVLPTPVGLADVRERLKMADVYLDAFPISSGLVLAEALRLGLPCVVWEGEQRRFRMGSALLRELELPEAIASDETKYLAHAVGLGQNSEQRARFTAALNRRTETAPRFLDSRRFAAQLQEILRGLLKSKHVAIPLVA